MERVGKSKRDVLLPSYPLRVEFEVASTCNLNCVYCYAQPFTNMIPSKEVLDYFFTKTKAEANPFEVVLIGGEPFVRSDIIDVLESANKIFKTTVTISTNGTLIERLTETELERLKAVVRNSALIQVSLDSVKPEVNDRTRGKTIATLNGLDILEKHQIPFTVGIVITTINERDVLDSTEYLMSRYSQMMLLNLEPLQPTVKTKNYANLRPDSKSMYNIFLKADELKSRLRKENVRVVEVIERCNDRCEEALLDSYRFKTCTAGVIQAGVLVNGDVTPCLNLRSTILGNLYNESWREIWSKSIGRFTSLDIDVEQCQLQR